MKPSGKHGEVSIRPLSVAHTEANTFLECSTWYPQNTPCKSLLVAKSVHLCLGTPEPDASFCRTPEFCCRELGERM